MELFERIDSVITQKGLSRKAVAALLGIPQPTFSRYFCVPQQDKLAPLLWKLTKLWPDVPRNWLFFGEGEQPDVQPFSTPSPTTEELETLKSKVAEVDSLKDRLLGALARNEALHRELNEAKDKIIRFQERQEAESLDKVDIVSTPPIVHGEQPNHQ